MAGIRLRCDHRDLSGAVRTLYIYDRDLVASQDNIVLCTSDFYVLKHEGDINDPFKRIIPCNCQFTIFLQHPNYTTDEEDEVNLFFNDLITSHEGRFYVRCVYGEDLGEIEAEFYGKILPDIGELTLDQWQTVQLTAIDGISGLKDVEYRPTGYSDLLPEYAIGSTSFKDHFTDILTRNDVVEFFQDTIAAFNTSMFTTSAFWTESKSIAGDIFTQVKVRNVWFEQVSPSYRKYKSCYEVLEQLLTGFVARCVYASGKYHIEQLPYQDNLTLVRYGYKYNGDPMAGVTYGNKTTLNYTTDDNTRALTWPSKRWLSPFKAIELEGAPVFTNYINGLNILATYPGYDGNDLFTYEYIIATGNKLISQWNFNFTRFPVIMDDFYVNMVLRFKIKIGDYYLRHPSNDTVYLWTGQQYFTMTDGSVPKFEWSLTDSTVSIGWSTVIAGNDLQTTNEVFNLWLTLLGNTSFVFESLEIQQDGIMTMEIIDFIATDYNTLIVIGSDPYPAITFKAASRLIIGGSYNDLYEHPKTIKIYEVGNINNTLIHKVKLLYYDHPLPLFPKLFIQNATYNTTHISTVEWTDPDAVITAPIQELMMQTMLAMRQYPAEVYKMDFVFLEDALFRMDKRVSIDGNLYIPLDLEIFSGTGVHRVSLLKVYKDFTGINVIDTGEPEISNPIPIPDGGLDHIFPPGSGGVQYFEEWTNVSVNYVEVSNLAGYIGDEYSVKTKVHLIVNGVRQKYTTGVAPTPNVQNREFDVDTATDRIYFGKGSGNVKHVELIVYW